MSRLSINTAVTAPLDPGLLPAVLFNRDCIARVRASGKAVPLVLGLERECGLTSRFETLVNSSADAETRIYVERIIKFLLWSRGGWKLHVGGPKAIGEFIRRTYSARGGRKFDCKMMELAYSHKFEVVLTAADKVPAAKDMQVAAGGHLKGCRIGFDLGASDYKVSAMIDGEAALHRAAAHMPRVDAIGGSSPPASSWTTKSASPPCCVRSPKSCSRRRQPFSSGSRRNGTCRSS